MNPTEMKEFVTEFLDTVWTRGDVSHVDRYLAPRYQIRSDPGDPWDGRTLTREEFANRLTTSRAPFPDQAFTVEEAVCDGESVAVAWRWKGTHLADAPGFPASGKSVTTSGLTIYSFEDGKLSGHRQQTDRLSVFQQLAKG